MRNKETEYRVTFGHDAYHTWFGVFGGRSSKKGGYRIYIYGLTNIINFTITKRW